MAMKLNPYINLLGNTREAIHFYQGVLGGEVSLLTFGEMGGEGDVADLVMHSQLETPDGFTLMCADVMPGTAHTEPTSMSVSLSGDDDERLRGYFAALSEGGTVETPLFVAPWGDEFGAFKDKFGVSWLVNIARPQA